MVSKDTLSKVMVLKNNFKNIRIRPWVYKNNIHAFDIETFLFNNMHIPYCIGYFNNNHFHTFYIDNNINEFNYQQLSSKLLLDFIQHIFNNPKLNKHYFYAHNMGRFDGVLLLKVLASKYKIQIIKKDNKILKITIFNDSMKIYLLDSLNLINGSLDSIAKSFKLTSNKTDFPYAFININTLFYKGLIPSDKYWKSRNIDIDRDRNNLEWSCSNETTNPSNTTWKGLYFSEELKSLMKYGYKIKV
jgi:hypothetical protein